MKTERPLLLTLRITGDDDLEVYITEPQSGETDRFLFTYSPDEHPEFDQIIGNQLYEWLKMWQEEE